MIVDWVRGSYGQNVAGRQVRHRVSALPNLLPDLLTTLLVESFLLLLAGWLDWLARWTGWLDEPEMRASWFGNSVAAKPGFISSGRPSQG